MGKKKKSFDMISRYSWILNKLGMVGYGFVRENISDTLSRTQIVQRLPATEFTDEAILLGVNFLGKKVGLSKIPLVRSILRAQETVEWARIGQTIKDIQDRRTETPISTGGAPAGLLF